MKYSIVVISNPAARSSSSDKVRKACQYLQTKGFKTEMHFTERRGHAEELARDAVKVTPHCIIAAGGDGTINEVINGMAMSKTPLAILPLGTTNVLARELGIPFNIEAAVEKAISGQPRSISLGKIELSGSKTINRYFCLMAGIGFDAEAVHGISSSIKKFSGEAAYILNGIKRLLGYRPEALDINVDGTTYKGYSAIIGNCSRYGGDFRVTPDADIYDPHLQVCIFKGSRRSDILRYAIGVVRGRHLKFRDVSCLMASNIEIAGSADIQIDGDYFGKSPAKISVIPDALKLIS